VEQLKDLLGTLPDPKLRRTPNRFIGPSMSHIINQVIAHPKEAQDEIKNTWASAYGRIKDIVINEDKVLENIGDLRATRDRRDPRYYFNIASLYAEHGERDLDLRNDRWNDDMNRVQDIFARYRVKGSGSSSSSSSSAAAARSRSKSRSKSPPKSRGGSQTRRRKRV